MRYDNLVYDCCDARARYTYTRYPQSRMVVHRGAALFLRVYSIFFLQASESGKSIALVAPKTLYWEQEAELASLQSDSRCVPGRTKKRTSRVGLCVTTIYIMIVVDARARRTRCPSAPDAETSRGCFVSENSVQHLVSPGKRYYFSFSFSSIRLKVRSRAKQKTHIPR